MELVSRIEAVKICSGRSSVEAGWIKMLDQLYESVWWLCASRKDGHQRSSTPWTLGRQFSTEKGVSLLVCAGNNWDKDFDLLCITLTKLSVVEISHDKQPIYELVPSVLSKISLETKKSTFFPSFSSIKISVLISFTFVSSVVWMIGPHPVFILCAWIKYFY